MLKIIKAADIAKRAMRENEALKAENAGLKAKLDYMAMMTDIDLEEESESTEGQSYVEEV